jgi:hypothetical protein
MGVSDWKSKLGFPQNLENHRKSNRQSQNTLSRKIKFTLSPTFEILLTARICHTDPERDEYLIPHFSPSPPLIKLNWFGL